jgi:membrane protease YdiL (CAAX protease family)
VLTGIFMFPAMLLGPSVSGILLTRVLEGRAGIRALFAQLFRWRVSLRWYLLLLLPPALVLAVLLVLKTFVSPVYAPNRFWLGILFGVPAGLLEEIGWSGFAFPKWLPEKNPFAIALAVGLLWVLWHAPVINFLGVATPHEQHWLAFFLAFGLAMTAMRVLIYWIYRQTGSVLLTQLMHISSTGALVIFGAPRVNAIQEATWYAVYGGVLWLIVFAVVFGSGSALGLRAIDSSASA